MFQKYFRNISKSKKIKKVPCFSKKTWTFFLFIDIIKKIKSWRSIVKKVVKVISWCLIICTLLNTVISTVYADWWGDATSWYNGEGFGPSSNNPNEKDPIKPEDLDSAVPEKAQDVIDAFENMVNIVGTTIIVLVTIFLGIKYMFGSFESKAEVKESLMNLVVACIFFFGWNSIWNLLISDGEFIFSKGATDYQSVIAKIFNTLTNIANFLAVGAVIYIGIRYIFAGAQGKAELKGKSGQFIIGMILAFCSVGFLNYISDLIKKIFG